jgi:glycerol-3-phosphate dehydrogenase
MLTLTPWRGAAIVGTSQSSTFLSPEDEQPTTADVAGLITDANDAFPLLGLDAGGVTLVHRGIVPAERDRSGRPMLKRHAEVLDHERDGATGAMTVVGVKYTTARATAERAVSIATTKLGKRGTRCRTGEHVLPGASIADHEALAIETEHRLRVAFDDRTRAHLTSLYGARCVDVIEIAAADEVLLSHLGEQTPAIGAEVVHAIRSESARHLDDVLMRRCTIGAARWPGDDVVRHAADIAARELGWTAAQRQEEIEALRSMYFA